MKKSVTWDTSKWYHITFSLDSASGVGVVYFNGVPLTPISANPASIPLASYMTFGPNIDWTEPFGGSVDEIAVFNRALSQQEIVDLYAKGTIGTPYCDAAPPRGVCGNSIIEPGEQCDDGNTNSNDGCSSTCQIEPGCPLGLVSYWKFDENSGTTAADSRSAINGQINGAAWTTGKIGNALDFDGINDNVIIPSNSALRPSAMTVAMWIKPHNYRMMLFSYGGQNDLYLQNHGFVRYGTDSSDCSSHQYTTNYLWDIFQNTWTFIALTHDGTTTRSYVNGQGPGGYYYDQTGLCRALSQTYIGSGWGGIEPTDGDIDEVVFFNRALSESEIRALYDYSNEGHQYCNAAIPVCGNNVIEAGEQCDDGNTQNGDCCSSTCQNEAVLAISSCQDLQKMQCNLMGNYYLTQDIDCSDTKNWDNGHGFAAVGPTDVYPFSGKFDGQNHTISNLYINRNTNYVGLFGFGKNYEIKNVGLVNVNLTWGFFNGAFVAYSQSGTISNSYSTGTIASSTEFSGGLVGFNAGAILNSYSTANVNTAGTQSCGEAGGLTGHNSGTISNSYSTGGISSPCEAGGLAGNNDGLINNSYANGSVIANTGNYAGGLVGYNHGPISTSYSTASVSGAILTGGIAGINFNTVSNSFWNTQISGGACAGNNFGNIATCYGKTTAQMKQSAIFAGWDFTNIWNICGGTTYPWLRWRGISCGVGFQPPTCTDADTDGIKAEGGVCGTQDNCPNEKNPDQTDMDADSMGDVCDNCPACKGAGCCVEQYSTGENLAPNQHLVINTGDAVIDIPAGSVSKNVSVSITKGVETNFKICIPDAGECGTTVSSYTIGKISQTFTNDYTLKLSYGDVPACAEGACEIWYNDGTGWRNIFGVPDIEGGFLVVHGNHFSEYAIVKKQAFFKITDVMTGPLETKLISFLLNSEYNAWSQQFAADYDSSYFNVDSCNVNVGDASTVDYGAGKLSAVISGLIPGNSNVMDCSLHASSAPEGIYSVSLRDNMLADANGGAIDVVPFDGTITVDATPPTVTVIKPESWTSSAAYVYIQCSDAVSGCAEIKYGLAEDSGSCIADQVYQGSVEVDSTQYLCYTAKDAAGNSASGVELIDYFDFDAPNTIATPAGVACNY
jgi:cysteine-rich repeat protein